MSRTRILCKRPFFFFCYLFWILEDSGVSSTKFDSCNEHKSLKIKTVLFGILREYFRSRSKSYFNRSNPDCRGDVVYNNFLFFRRYGNG